MELLMSNKILPTLKTGWDFFGGGGLGDGENELYV
jgi:hypothetical protein